jgi:hypothetical protein
MSFPQASNNEAEYEALLHGMGMAKACGATRLKIFGDSNLVVQQVMNRCDAISNNMTADTPQTYLSFLMLHACSYTICLVFCYTLSHFYAFSETNLLTRCHSVSFLFSAIFVFQKSYRRNILGIG